ncbi:MAG: SDR family NAD(P)-dependent oxidoreductase [bacterium]
MTFENKTVIITGASTGIGKALVKELADYNCTLFILARRINLLEEIIEELKDKPAKIYCVYNDVGDKDSVAEAYKQITAISQKIDVAILNSGVGFHMTVEKFNSKLAEDTFRANFFGLVYWTEQLLPMFVKNKAGLIAGTSSLADNRGYSGSGFYCASKAAASIYLEGLRVELIKHKVKVITIKPGFVKTPMTDINTFKMPFLMQPEEAAKIIIAGIKKEKRIIQFPLPIVLSTKLVGLIPNFIYDFLIQRAK